MDVAFEYPAQAIGLRYFQPAADIRALVASYYVFHARMDQVSDMMRADLAQIRFMVSGRGAYHFQSGEKSQTPEVCLIGPTFGATRFQVDGPVLVFGISLLPAGWAALVREDASRHADRVEDATALFGRVMREALDAMRAEQTMSAMVGIADVMMRVLVEDAVEGPLWFTRLTDRWLTGAASPDVDGLIRESGMSSRQIERLARRIYGAPPKLLARKYRALRAASTLSAGKVPWLEAVGDAFYDQSHFIREFKQFTGLTPRQFQSNPPPVMRLSLGRRALAGKLPALSLIT